MLSRRSLAGRRIRRQLDRGGIQYGATDHMDGASHYKLIVLLPDGRSLDSVKKALAEEGVLLGGGVYEIPCHRQPVFEGICAGESYPGADRWCPNHICPPLTSGITHDQARFIAELLGTHL